MGPEPHRPRPVGARTLVFVGILAAALLAAWSLDLATTGLSTDRARLAAAGEFFSRAISPSAVSEAPPPFGGRSILGNVLEGTVRTVSFAGAAFGLAVAMGLVLGFFASTAWWAGDPAGGSTLARLARRSVLPAMYGATRVLIAVMRSIHELIWAVLLLSAMGRSDLAAILALAIPYAGTVAKVFSEMVDEAPRGAAVALRAAGAAPMQVFSFGLLPRALPDMASYGFYQFECTLRSSAILGFFGFPTLGYYIAASFENLYYGEVWTYLYALFVLILVAEWWSAEARRRLVS